MEEDPVIGAGCWLRWLDGARNGCSKDSTVRLCTCPCLSTLKSGLCWSLCDFGVASYSHSEATITGLVSLALPSRVIEANTDEKQISLRANGVVESTYLEQAKEISSCF